jgi:hypothetical protein
LLDSNVKLSQDVRMAQDKSFKNQGLSIWILDADLRCHGLVLEREEVLSASPDLTENRLSSLALVFLLLRWDNNLLFWLTKSKLLIIEMLGSLSVLDATLDTKDYVLKNMRLHDVFEVF